MVKTLCTGKAENRKAARGGRVPSFNLKLADGDAVTVNKRPKLAEFLKAMNRISCTSFYRCIELLCRTPSSTDSTPNVPFSSVACIVKGRTPTGTGAFAKDLNLHFKD